MGVKWSDLTTSGAINDTDVLRLLLDLATDAALVRAMIRRDAEFGDIVNTVGRMRNQLGALSAACSVKAISALAGKSEK